MTLTGLRRAIICDIDGTLAHMGERSPYDWHRVREDTTDQVVIEVLRRFDDHEVILVSGRDAICRRETVDWLKENRIPFHHLFMRPERDSRKDVEIKQEIYDNEIKGKFSVTLVLDDRNQVVKMWRDNGLKCLQVAEGDF